MKIEGVVAVKGKEVVLQIKPPNRWMLRESSGCVEGGGDVLVGLFYANVIFIHSQSGRDAVMIGKLRKRKLA